MEWKSKLLISVGIDVGDLLLGLVGAFLNVPFPGVAVVLNNFRGVIYDLVSVPVMFYLFGGLGAIGIVEVVLPEEIDMFVPTCTIVALLSRKKKRKKR